LTIEVFTHRVLHSSKVFRYVFDSPELNTKCGTSVLSHLDRLRVSCCHCLAQHTCT